MILAGLFPPSLATVMADPLPLRAPCYDQSALIALAAGGLLALITLFTAYDHVDLPGGTSFQLNQQWGLSLLLASLAALLVDTKLATRSRFEAEATRRREADSAAEERQRASEERNRAAEERERQAGRAQRQTRSTMAQLQHSLEPSKESRQRLRALIALLSEYGELG